MGSNIAYPHLERQLCWGLSPNITGALLSTRSYGKTTGAFYEGDGRGYVHDEHTDKGIVAFSASRSSSQYREASTVQPPAFQALIIIKV